MKKKNKEEVTKRPSKRFLQNTWEKYRDITMEAAKEAEVEMIMEGSGLDQKGNPVQGLTRLLTAEPEKGNLEKFYSLRHQKMMAIRRGYDSGVGA